MQPEQAERLAELVEHAFELEVALKLVRAGMDPAEIVARFRHEEQILASLNHPNIAQLKTRLSAPRESLRILEQTRPGRAMPRFAARIEFEIRHMLRARDSDIRRPLRTVRSLDYRSDRRWRNVN